MHPESDAIVPGDARETSILAFRGALEMDWNGIGTGSQPRTTGTAAPRQRQLWCPSYKPR